MNLENIEKILKILNDSNLESITYKDKNFEVSMKKASSNENLTAPIDPKPTTINPQVIQDENNIVKSPLVGVYYSKPSPEEESFVTVNQSVKKGQILCIIESMKVMNEIKAPKDGIIQTVYLIDGDMVDFDQPLFNIQ